MTQHVRKGRQGKARRQWRAAYWKAFWYGFNDAWDAWNETQQSWYVAPDQEQMEAMAKQYENYQYTPYIKPLLVVSG